MNIMHELRNYVLEEEFTLNYKNGKLSITNYINIPIFEANEIHIGYKYGKVIILGKNLIIARLVKDELLVTGRIDKIEFKLKDE
jgi:sporulation protein YqfC